MTHQRKAGARTPRGNAGKRLAEQLRQAGDADADNTASEALDATGLRDASEEEFYAGAFKDLEQKKKLTPPRVAGAKAKPVRMKFMRFELRHTRAPGA